jgi:hypothetical protein
VVSGNLGRRNGGLRIRGVVGRGLVLFLGRNLGRVRNPWFRMGGEELVVELMLLLKLDLSRRPPRQGLVQLGIGRSIGR